MKLENAIRTYALPEGVFLMAKRIQQRVSINGEVRWISGATRQELFDELCAQGYARETILKTCRRACLAMPPPPSRKNVISSSVKPPSAPPAP